MYADVSNEKVEGNKLVVENFSNYYEKSGSKRQKYMKYEIYPQLTNETYKGWMYGMYKVYTDYKKTTIAQTLNISVSTITRFCDNRVNPDYRLYYESLDDSTKHLFVEEIQEEYNFKTI